MSIIALMAHMLILVN